MSADVLEEILAVRKEEVEQDKKRKPFTDLERAAGSGPVPKNFLEAVSQPGKIAVIAEMKRRSPSAGLIRGDYDVAAIAAAYEKGGVRALSVLTEPLRFEGNIEDIVRARSASRLPILRKDFIFDPYQIVEARVAGADAVLLIADMLSPTDLRNLVSCAKQFALTPLVEVFTEKTVAAALESGATLIGINARNLRTLEMVPDNVARLSRLIPEGFSIVAESGIRSSAGVAELKKTRVSAVLVGESLLKQADLEKAARSLVEAGE